MPFLVTKPISLKNPLINENYLPSFKITSYDTLPSHKKRLDGLHSKACKAQSCLWEYIAPMVHCTNDMVTAAICWAHTVHQAQLSTLQTLLLWIFPTTTWDRNQHQHLKRANIARLGQSADLSPGLPSPQLTHLTTTVAHDQGHLIKFTSVLSLCSSQSFCIFILTFLFVLPFHKQFYFIIMGFKYHF